MLLALVRHLYHIPSSSKTHHNKLAGWGSVVVNWYVIHFLDYSRVHVGFPDSVHFSNLRPHRTEKVGS
jgi:hypothetical protein